jgi:selenocysteine lyase/cysteine desulfurase
MTIKRKKLEKYLHDKNSADYVDFIGRAKEVKKLFAEFAEKLNKLDVELSNPYETQIYCVNLRDKKSNQWIQTLDIQEIINAEDDGGEEIDDEY